MDIKDYLHAEYELKTRFFTDHLGRMWTRFNYFLVTETAIVGGRVVLSPQGQYNKALLWLGLIISIIWYLMGAQDRYLAELYRQELQETFRQMKQANNFQEKSDAPLYHAGQVDGVKFNVTSLPTSWRIKPISPTRLAAWIPLLVTVFWAVWLLR